MSLKNAMQAYAIWSAAQEQEPDIEEALCILADAIAVACCDHDLHPGRLLDRISETFDRLHIAKYAPHLGRKQ